MSNYPARELYQLTKPKITLLVLIVSYCGMYMAEGKTPDPVLAFFTLLGLGLASSSSSVLNNYIDRGIDNIMERTQKRGLPTGKVQPSHALALGLVTGLSSTAILAWQVNYLTASLSSFAILAYIFIYTIWLKRTSEHCTVIGGVAGALPPVMGLTAVTGEINAAAVIMFVILFLWQPPHFWALALIRAEEYRAAGIPMLPVVKGPEETKRQMLYYTIALAPTSLLPWFFNISGAFYLASAVLLSSIYLGWTILFIRAPFDPKASRKLFLFSILYISLIYSLMVINCHIVVPSI
jgi:protoheme IX farnesyltransferase